jgi:hypothetical protein
VAGPWRILEMPGQRFGVFRLGESPERGHRPAAVFQERWLALLAAAVLPGTGRDAELRLHKEAGPEGYAIETGNGVELAGHSELFDERLIEALHVVACLARSPRRWRTSWRPRVPWRLIGRGRFWTSGFRRRRTEARGAGSPVCWLPAPFQGFGGGWRAS